MITYLIEQTAAAFDAEARDSIGGRPVLPAGFDWPACDCGERMVLFLQFDILQEFGLPFAQGSHLSVFMCPVHNDAPEMFDAPQLPQGFWDRRRMIDGQTRFYELLLHRPNSPETVHTPDSVLLPQHLRFTRQAEVPDSEDVSLQEHSAYPGVSLSVGELIGGIQEFKVGGQPSWAQTPEVHRCCCGAEMRFLCQVPDGYPFPKRPDAPAQPDSFSDDDYCLFLGNEVYLFACEAQCDPRAVHPVVQN
jgi:hypothetical protein